MKNKIALLCADYITKLKLHHSLIAVFVAAPAVTLCTMHPSGIANVHYVVLSLYISKIEGFARYFLWIETTSLPKQSL